MKTFVSFFKKEQKKQGRTLDSIIFQGILPRPSCLFFLFFWTAHKFRWDKDLLQFSCGLRINDLDYSYRLFYVSLRQKNRLLTKVTTYNRIVQKFNLLFQMNITSRRQQQFSPYSCSTAKQLYTLLNTLLLCCRASQREYRMDKEVFVTVSYLHLTPYYTR